MELSCKSDGEFEFCNWKHENEYCFYEWKFASKRVEQQQCSTSIRRRVRYIGDSVKNVRECKSMYANLSKKQSVDISTKQKSTTIMAHE